ncbi:immunoglobulin-like domain-containing protein [Sphingobacterium athyrii]|uniref:immunoglobulin-like domain-containing protein n=1 Tax=Sphingobacterium athyrii TaxID=2152717 RepID=UPI0028ACBA3F|nr:immunoglobulin-like domain-containing protein [Sphingobacterium athyrii]
MRRFQKIAFAYFVFLSGLLILGCRQNTDRNGNNIIGQDSLAHKIENKGLADRKVLITVNPAIYDLSKNENIIYYRLTNNSPTVIQFGSHFLIEKQSDLNWVKESFVDNIAFEDILYGIEPKESQDFQIPLSKMLKNKRLAPGIYRISKEVWFADQKKEPFQVVASFEIK